MSPISALGPRDPNWQMSTCWRDACRQKCVCAVGLESIRGWRMGKGSAHEICAQEAVDDYDCYDDDDEVIRMLGRF